MISIDYSSSGELSALAARIKNGTLFHAYILCGEDAALKDELALDMASSFVCTGSGEKPCGKCRDCRKAKSGIHPDIIYIEKQSDKSEILIGQIRAMRTDAFVVPNEAHAKVYVIKEADKMNANAQNALLKILEEPPTYASFILLAENPGAFLDTILSRCVLVPLMPNLAQSNSGTAFEYAERFINIICQGKTSDICEFTFAAEKLEKNEFYDFLRFCTARAVRKMADGCEESAMVRLSHAAHVFAGAEPYIAQNVSNNNIAAYLTANLI